MTFSVGDSCGEERCAPIGSPHGAAARPRVHRLAEDLALGTDVAKERHPAGMDKELGERDVHPPVEVEREGSAL